VLTLVYSLASTIPRFAAQTGRTLKIFQEISRSSRCAYSSVSCLWRHFVRCENSLFKFHLGLWFVITLYSCGTVFGIHNV
jgi:hypothetical protein